jgi:hypothetical protein
MRHRTAGLWAIALLAAAAFMDARAADVMSVQVKQTQVRETPAYVGRILGVLNYGDQVTVQEKRPG